MKNFNLFYLKYFCDAVSLGSVSAAAKVNCVTQSAISQGISKLEESLNVDLIKKHPNRFRSTPEGDKAFRDGVSILAMVEEFQGSFSEDSMEMVGPLEFAATHSLAVSVVPQYLQRFKSLHPNISVKFRAGTKEKIKQMLKIGEIDFGIMADEGDLSEFENLEIFNGLFGLYCVEHLANTKLDQQQFVVAGEKCREVLFFKDLYHKTYAKPLPTLLEVDSWEIIANFAAAGLGIGYFPDYIAERHKDSLKRHESEFIDFRYRICVIYLKGTRLHKSSKAFFNLVIPS